MAVPGMKTTEYMLDLGRQTLNTYSGWASCDFRRHWIVSINKGLDGNVG